MMKLPIARPPWSKLGKKLESTVRKALFDFSLLDGNKKIAIALSGGKDSLTLLFLLAAIRGKGVAPFDIVAIHINGSYTCGASVDSNFLMRVCDELQVEYVTKECNQEIEDLQCYSCSRKRRSLIFDLAKRSGATTIAFGHHSDDSAQTLLLNLLGKGEFSANHPKIKMHRYGCTIIRPLIYIRESDIINFARHHGFFRISCRCPVGQNSMRKKADIILDELAEIFPNARENIARAGLKYGSDKALRNHQGETS